MTDWLGPLTQERQRQEESRREAEELARDYISQISEAIDQLFQDVLEYVQASVADIPGLSYVMESHRTPAGWIWAISLAFSGSGTSPWISLSISANNYPSHNSNDYRTVVEFRDRSEEYPATFSIEGFSVDRLKALLFNATSRETRGRPV